MLFIFPLKENLFLMKNKNLDLSLYLVTDRSLAKDKDLLWIIKEAVSGGVSVVQLREKELSSCEFFSLAKKIKIFLDSCNIPLIINDRVDIALAVEAAGVHLGQSDLPCQVARNILGENKIIGISVENINQALQAKKSGANYIAYSPVFFTKSKNDINKPLGLQGVKQISNLLNLPGIGIGGINFDNAKEVIKAGAFGIAVISAIINSENPQKAAFKLRQIVDKAKQKCS